MAALAAAALASLELGTRARVGWRSYAMPLERPLPRGLSPLGLTAAVGDAGRVAADLSYIEVLQYVATRARGLENGWADTYQRYAEVQWLDPGFKHAIIEGISLLGWLFQRPAEAQSLAQRAMTDDPGEKRYSAYLAALAYQKRLDMDKVLETLAPELAREDCPDMVLRMAGNLLLLKRDWGRAERYWAWAAGRMKTDEDRTFASRSMEAAQGHFTSLRQMEQHAPR